MKLYHGTNKPNLKSILPNRSGYVYTTSELVFSLIFSSRQRNSLTARWGMNKDNVPYFCEKVEGIFDSLYENLQSYIYVLDSKNFFQKENSWKYEYISPNEEKVLEEIEVKNIKEYLFNLEEQGKFQLIRYKDRKKYFPNIDEEAINTALGIYKKYGKERALKDVKNLRPDILEEVENLIGNL